MPRALILANLSVNVAPRARSSSPIANLSVNVAPRTARTYANDWVQLLGRNLQGFQIPIETDYQYR